MLTVSVINAQFNAPIGLYPQEAKTMNQIEVDVHISTKASIQSLPFIDYTILYQMVKSVIEKHHKTLEEIVSELFKNIKASHPEAQISIKVRKLNPPLSGQVHCTQVGFEG